MKGRLSVWLLVVLGCVLLASPVAFGMEEPTDTEAIYSSNSVFSKMDEPLDPEGLYANEELWASPDHDLSIFAKVPKRASRQASNATILNPSAYGISSEAIAWCIKQRGVVEYRQYSYINAKAKLVAFGRTRAYCDFGSYTLVEVETLAAPYPTLAQMAYMNPIPNYKWNRKGIPACEYCIAKEASSYGSMFIKEMGNCVNTGWSHIPVEESAGLSLSCEFSDGSAIEPWALLNGRFDQRVAKKFRYQFKGSKICS